MANGWRTAITALAGAKVARPAYGEPPLVQNTTH